MAKKLLIVMMMLVTNSLLAKPRDVNVVEEFGTAIFVGEVVITGYDHGKILFKSTQFSDTISWAHCDSNLIKGKRNPPLFGKEYWTENMPFVGDTVLVVISGARWPSLYGKKMTTHYRLWSPSYTGSVALFQFEEPIIAISKEFIPRMSPGSKTICWDGCLVPVDKVGELIVLYRNRIAKMIDLVDLKRHKFEYAYDVFYDDTLSLYTKMVWHKDASGKLKSLQLDYCNKKMLMLNFITTKYTPAEFLWADQDDEKKRLRVKEMKWVTPDSISPANHFIP